MNKTAHNKSEQSLMEDLCRYIEAYSHEPLTLEKLAAEAHLSPGHLQRRFKAIIGVSPKEYLESCRMGKLKHNLKKSSSVTQAIYESGFGSSSRVYERADSKLGMTPKQYSAKGKKQEISYAEAQTPLGKMLLSATDRGICFIQFGENSTKLVKELEMEFPEATITPMPEKFKAQFKAWIKALSDYLKGEQVVFDLPLDIKGTAFQMKVWKYLQSIPSGAVESYTDVAKGIGHPKAVRAVASACASNKITIIIPCHRVIRGSGELAGYRWGLERKHKLIELEKSK